MDPTAPLRAHLVPLQRAALGLVLLAAAAYALTLWRHAGVVAGGSDSSGYLNQARLFQEGRLRAVMRPLPGLGPDRAPLYAYVPLGFVPRPEEAALVPTYPSGLSLLLAASAKLAGWKLGPTLTLILHALGGLALVHALGRTAGLAPSVSLLGALMLAVSPLYVMFSLQAMSDQPALVWSGAAVLFAWHAGRHSGLAVAAGLSLAVAVLLRPTNILMLVPVLVALGPAWRRWLWLGLGGLPGALWFFYLNYRSYGHPLLTGYGDVGLLLSPAWVLPGLRHYVQWLPVLAGPPVVLALGLPWLPRRVALVLGSWIGVMLGFYAFYFHTHETWWYLRFVLPAFPPLIVAALLVATRLLAARPAAVRRFAGLVAVLVVVAGAWHWHRRWQILETGRQERHYVEAAAWTRDHLPADSILLAMQASGALFHYTDRVIIRWDTLDDRWPQVRAAAADRPVHAVLFDFELPTALQDKTPGRWTKLHEAGPITFWRLEPGP